MPGAWARFHRLCLRVCVCLCVALSLLFGSAAPYESSVGLSMHTHSLTHSRTQCREVSNSNCRARANAARMPHLSKAAVGVISQLDAPIVYRPRGHTQSIFHRDQSRCSPSCHTSIRSDFPSRTPTQSTTFPNDPCPTKTHPIAERRPTPYLLPDPAKIPFPTLFCIHPLVSIFRPPVKPHSTLLTPTPALSHHPGPSTVTKKRHAVITSATSSTQSFDSTTPPRSSDPPCSNQGSSPR